METFPPTSVAGNVSYTQGLGSSVTLPPQQPYPSAVVIICSIVLLVSPIVAACCKLRSRRRQPQTVPNTVDEALQAKTAKEVKVKRIDLYIQSNSIILEDKNFCRNANAIGGTTLNDNDPSNEIKRDSTDLAIVPTTDAGDIDDSKIDLSTSERFASGLVSIEIGLKSGLCPPEGTRREISSICAICINAYRVGDSVVWAFNPECKHVFHSSCMKRWLLKDRSQCLCPCCRQPFLADDLPDLEKGTL